MKMALRPISGRARAESSQCIVVCSQASIARKCNGILSGTFFFSPAFISASSMSTDYLKRILTSKVYDVAHETPLEPAPQVSARTGNNILLKREDTQPVFSFKLR